MSTSKYPLSVLSIVIALGTVVHADPSPTTGQSHLTHAKTALDELDYEKAKVALRAAVRAGDLDRQTLAEAYGLSGRVAAAFGDEDQARDDYVRMLTLDSKAVLPPGLAPKLVRPFTRARKLVAGSGGLTVTAAARGHNKRRVRISVTGDPLSMASTAIVAFREPGAERRVRAALDNGAATVRAPKSAAGGVRVFIIDRAGNPLAETSAQLPARPARPAKPVRVAPDPDPEPEPDVATAPVEATSALPRRRVPVFARWQVWGGLAVLSGGAAAYFGQRAFDDWNRLDTVISNSRDHDFQEARDLEASGRRHQLYANVALGAAVVCAGVSTYLLLRGAPKAESPRVTATLGGGGAGIAVTGVFR